MATKTVVCPECGSEVAPGRYACSECGSLLAAVSSTPRAPLTEVATEPEVSMLADDGEDEASEPEPEPAAEPDWAAEPEPAAEAEPAVHAESEPDLAVSDATEPSLTESPVPALEDDGTEPDAEVDEDRPLAAFAEAPVAATPIAPVAATPIAPVAATPIAPVAAIPIAPVAAPVSGAPATDAPVAAAPVNEPAVAEPAVLRGVPTWPPVDDRGIDPPPVRPTPAGAWLPPSAHLDGLAVPEPAASTHTAGVRGGHGGSTAAGSASPGLGGFATSFDLADDAPRQVIGAGAGLAAVGFLLPWANVLAGAGLLGDYFTQWGVAGPGHWIVVSLLAALAALAFVGGRFAAWPVGHVAVVLAALLVGLLWPYLFGVLGRSVGVWTVLAGAIVLAVGGVLERRARHGSGAPAVQTPIPGP